MTREQRALACAAGIVPTTVAGAALLRFGHPGIGWTIEITTAAAYFAWIAAGRRADKRRARWTQSGRK